MNLGIVLLPSLSYQLTSHQKINFSYFRFLIGGFENAVRLFFFRFLIVTKSLDRNSVDEQNNFNWIWMSFHVRLFPKPIQNQKEFFKQFSLKTKKYQV